MRRHPALHRLSREHSPALSLARRLINAETTAGIALAQSAVRRWLPTLLQHFVDEETVLLPLLQQLGEAASVARLLIDHQQLRAALTRLAEANLAPHPAVMAQNSSQLQAIGEQLRAHVHFEERQLFPRLEQSLTASQWQAVATALASHGAS